MSLAKMGFADPLSVEVATIDEEQTPSSTTNQLSFTATLSSSYIAPEELDEAVDEMSTKEKKKMLKTLKVDEPRKRKDTAISISNFFHRFTRTDKDEKKVVEEEDGDETVRVVRPDRLLSPELEEKWFESRSTDLPYGHEGDAELYEWDPLTMNETLVEPMHFESTSSNAFFEEKSMLKLLDEFRNGEMRWLAEPQVSAMCRVKEAHEDVTDTHLRIYEIESERRKQDTGLASFTSKEEAESEKMIEQLFEQMNVQMVKMHSFLDRVPFYDDAQSSAPNDEEYYSS